MRVLISIAELATGGAERVVVELAYGLQARGDEVAVAGAPGRFDDDLDGSIVRRFSIPGRGGSPLTLLRGVFGLRSAIREFEPDVMHSHNVKATGMALVARQIARCGDPPLLATFHGVRRRQYRPAAMVLRRADLISCVSDDLASGLATAGIPAEMMAVVRNGVPLPPPLDPDRAGALKVELGLDGSVVMSLVARLVPQKAPDRFLRVAAQVAQARPDARFLVVGEGPLWPRLRRLAAELGIDGQVLFVGARDDARTLIAISDLVVFTSEWEGMPMVALESLASGVPVVATPAEGLNELLANDAGVVVPRDHHAIADAIVALLADAERRSRMGEAGKRRVAAEYGVDRMVDSYRRLLFGASHDRRRRSGPEA